MRNTILPAVPSHKDLAMLMLADFRRFNPETEDIRKILSENYLRPYMYDESRYTNVPFKSNVPNNSWKETYEQANAETDPDMVFYHLKKDNGNAKLVVCAYCESTNIKYDRKTDSYIEEKKNIWKCHVYMRGCSTAGFEDTLDKVINKTKILP